VNAPGIYTVKAASNFDMTSTSGSEPVLVQSFKTENTSIERRRIELKYESFQ